MNLAGNTFTSNQAVGPTRAIGIASVDCDVLCSAEIPECDGDIYNINGYDIIIGIGSSAFNETAAADNSADACGNERVDSLGLCNEVSASANANLGSFDEVRCKVFVGNYNCVGEGCACPPSSGNAACDMLNITYAAYRFTSNQYSSSHILVACAAPPGNSTPGVKSLSRHRGVFLLYVPPPTIVHGSPVPARADYGVIGGFEASEECAGEDGYLIEPTTVNDPQEFRVIAFDYLEKQLDADGNGFFDIDDYFFLPTLLGSTQRSDLQRFDYAHDPEDPDNNVLEQPELDTFRLLMMNLLIGDAQPGFYGDLNSDGYVSCLDLEQVSLHEGASFGDSNYLPEFDFNLDGTISQTEKGRLFDKVLSGDADWNQTVNFADITYIYTYWNQSVDPYTHGDVSGDGVVDYTDTTKVLANWSQSCN